MSVARSSVVSAAASVPADPELFREEVLAALPYLGDGDGVTVEGDLVTVAVPEEPGYSRARLQFDLAAAAVAHDPGQPEGAFERFLCYRAAAELSGSALGFIVGVSEAAEILGVSKQRVCELHDLDRLPPTLGHPRAGPIWWRPLIEQFADQRRQAAQVGRP